jgi:vanillate O-demethylase ferredoxin subunit
VIEVVEHTTSGATSDAGATASLEPTRRVRVARKAAEAVDICTFELVSVDGAPLAPFTAGSHIDVRLPGGVVRQYSLCNDPSESHRYVIGVLKEPASRGGSRTLHEQINEGDVIEIGGPRNHFPLAPNAGRSLLFAGGIGVTPLLCMAESLARSGADFEMHYCTRSRERTAFLDRIQRSAFAENVRFHFDDGPVSQQLEIAALLAEPQPATHLYVCGPKGFMDTVLSKARAQGWSEGNIHFEYFSAEPFANDGDRSFDVVLARTGVTVNVPKGTSVVEALAAVGVDIPTACQQGVCGTCITRVLEGEPDHRDLYLSPEEQATNDQFAPCCSRAKSARLVLDL